MSSPSLNAAASRLVPRGSRMLVLLVGAGLFLRTLDNLKHVDVGFDSQNLLMFNVNPGVNRYDEVRSGQVFRRVLERMSSLPGFGAQKAKIFTALLGKRYGVQPPGWREAAGVYGRDGVHMSIADVTGPESLQQVRAYKKEKKAAAKAARA